MQIYLQAVEPGKELSVEYSFIPPRELPANEYQIALTVFYDTIGGSGFKSTTFFNETITVNEKPQLIDTKLIFLYLIFIALVAAGGELSMSERLCMPGSISQGSCATVQATL
jgi:translocon-associated protein subunit alpha